MRHGRDLHGQIKAGLTAAQHDPVALRLRLVRESSGNFVRGRGRDLGERRFDHSCKMSAVITTDTRIHTFPTKEDRQLG